MQNEISLRETVQYAMNSNRTLLGIGPMSKYVMMSSLELGADQDFPVMFIASRNQIDCDKFGSGFASNWDQERFVNDVNQYKEKIGFNGLVYICRDHGGQWQRHSDITGKIPYEEATTNAYESYAADLRSGFDLIHVDPTLDPHSQNMPLESVIDRAVQTILYLETIRKNEGLPRVEYEIGTEENAGGTIEPHNFEMFIALMSNKLKEYNLPNPLFIVGQTGTLVRMDRNIGHFNPEASRELAKISRKYGMGFKEHNADYLEEGLLGAHPEIGITAANVAPEFGVVEARALFNLSERIGNTEFRSLLESYVLNGDRWKKWLDKEHRGATAYEIQNNPELKRKITEMVSYYYFDVPEVKSARVNLFSFAKKQGISDPEEIIKEEIKHTIRGYVKNFKLRGLTASLKAQKISNR